MIQQVLSKYPYGIASGVGLLLFLAVFVGVLVWIFRKGAPEFYNEIEKLPLKADSQE